MGCTEIVRIVESCLKENPCEIDVRYNEPMANHSTFRAGGPADCWLRPSGDGFPMFAASLLQSAGTADIPVFILGAGANILAADAGIRGIVLDTGGWRGETEQQQKDVLEFRAGTSIDMAGEIAASRGFSGLEFLAGMPGSVGGAVWMNARCYGNDIAGVLHGVKIIDYSINPPEQSVYLPDKADFGYKHSPFQGKKNLILSASFCLQHGDVKKIRAEMDANRQDREDKGHYRYPSAGSVFKNNSAFGRPTGKIIDELGLRAMQTGGAQVAPWHGNLIINHGGATSADIRSLVDKVAAQVKIGTGLSLEPEILFIGEW